MHRDAPRGHILGLELKQACAASARLPSWGAHTSSKVLHNCSRPSDEAQDWHRMLCQNSEDDELHGEEGEDGEESEDSDNEDSEESEESEDDDTDTVACRTRGIADGQETVGEDYGYDHDLQALQDLLQMAGGTHLTPEESAMQLSFQAEAVLDRDRVMQAAGQEWPQRGESREDNFARCDEEQEEATRGTGCDEEQEEATRGTGSLLRQALSLWKVQYLSAGPAPSTAPGSSNQTSPSHLPAEDDIIFRACGIHRECSNGRSLLAGALRSIASVFAVTPLVSVTPQAKVGHRICIAVVLSVLAHRIGWFAMRIAGARTSHGCGLVFMRGEARSTMAWKVHPWS